MGQYIFMIFKQIFFQPKWNITLWQITLKGIIVAEEFLYLPKDLSACSTQVEYFKKYSNLIK